jgi:hypothetical protein
VPHLAFDDNLPAPGDMDEEPTMPGKGVVVTVAALVRAIDSLKDEGRATREAFQTGMASLGKRIDRVVVALCILAGSLALVGAFGVWLFR